MIIISLDINENQKSKNHYIGNRDKEWTQFYERYFLVFRLIYSLS